MTKLTARAIEVRWRDTTTDDAVVGVLIEANGELQRRELARKLGHRHDFTSALARLTRKGRIELLTVNAPGRRPQSLVRLTGDAAEKAGCGFTQIKGAQ